MMPPPESSGFAYQNVPTDTPVPSWMGSFIMKARSGTDLWRKPNRDTCTCPVLYTKPTPPFTQASVLVALLPNNSPGLLEWDQGGLVIFAGQKWVKAGIEYVDGNTVASSVAASVDGADWSLIELPHGTIDLKVRFEKTGSTGLMVMFEDPMTLEWKKLRELNWFFAGVDEKSVKVGVYASRPVDLPYERGRQLDDSLRVEFEGLEIW